MRSGAIFVLALLFGLGAAVAEDPTTPSIGDVADEVAAAFTANDAKALERLAGRSSPDPWLVADSLVSRGQRAAAVAFANAARGADVERLAAYVAGIPSGESTRAALLQLRTLIAAHDWDGALRATATAESATDVPGIQTLFLRALAFRELSRRADSSRIYLVVADAANRIGWHSAEATALSMASEDLHASADPAAALKTLERRRLLEVKRGDRIGEMHALFNQGVLYGQSARFREASQELRRALEVARSVGHTEGIAESSLALGQAQSSAGLYGEAVAPFRDAVEAFTRLGDAARAAQALASLAQQERLTGKLAEAERHATRALEEAERLGLRDVSSEARTALGHVAMSRGELGAARRWHESALGIDRELGDDDAVAVDEANLGKVALARGALADGMRHFDRAVRIAEALPDPLPRLRAWLDMALGHIMVGDPRAAGALYEKALKLARARGDYDRQILALQGIAISRLDMARAEAAERPLDEALRLARETDNRWRGAELLLLRGRLLMALDRPKEAIEAYRLALDTHTGLGRETGHSVILGMLATAEEKAGNASVARNLFREVLARSEALGEEHVQVSALADLSRIRRKEGDHVEAMALARRGLEAAARVAGGLPDEEAGRARFRTDSVAGEGFLAALAASDLASAFSFLEAGRAGALVEGLGSRAALREAVLPQELAAAEAQARAAEVASRRALADARRAGVVAVVRERASAHADAQARLKEIAIRIQRDARTAAPLLESGGISAEAFRSRLRADEALLLYFVGDEQAHALVATREGLRAVDLGSPDVVLRAVDGLVLDDPTTSTEEAISTARDRLIRPLGLSAAVRRLLVSPHGPLTFIPFGVLAPEHEVVYVPSATTLAALDAEGGERGEGVLALGDPVYAAGGATVDSTGALPRLPGTRDEATAVGTRVLLGPDANESALRAALAERKRWRSVHLACHGKVDVRQPLLSSLALTPTKDDDGFLTALDIVRMAVPAELVVLSACETGRGRVVRGEGLFGLTRAFMFAGAPRVLVSLWQVDDQATLALMKRFYEEWNAADGTARASPSAALRRAQDHVRSQEQWRHPYYWAAWVLWGSP